MKELTKCLNCGKPLVSYEEVHAVRGGLYCSKSCAISDLANDYITNAKELAKEAYASEAEVLQTSDILSEDLYDVKIVVTCTKVVKMPKSFTEAEAIQEAISLWQDGIIVAEPDDCDYSEMKCELVKEDNSSCEEDA